MNPAYLATARLVTQIAPVVFESGIFALKGGTAINLFLRDMPRLSVDLDLVFTDHRIPRAEALAAINEALRAGRDRLVKLGFKVQAGSAADMGETKLLVQRDGLFVKIEVNTVIRGAVHPTQMAALTAAASASVSDGDGARHDDDDGDDRDGDDDGDDDEDGGSDGGDKHQGHRREPRRRSAALEPGHSESRVSDASINSTMRMAGPG